jgi:DNA polymerase-1
MTLLVSDQSALEVVVLADLTKRLFGDEQLANAVAPGAPDIHVVNATRVFGDFLKWRVPAEVLVEGEKVACVDAGMLVGEIPVQGFKQHLYGSVLRGLIKTVFYGWAYGKRGYGFATLEGADGRSIGEDRGNDLVAGLMAAMPGLGKWESWVIDYVDEWQGIYSLGGRWCDLSELMNSGQEWMRRRAYRRALNFPCQASGADIMGDAMVRIDADEDLRALGFTIVLQVHDELVLRGPLRNIERATVIVHHHMVSATANGTPLLVPLQASTGHGPDYHSAK